MSTIIDGDYLADSLQCITKMLRRNAIKRFLIADFFAGIDAGKTGINVPFFQNREYIEEADRIILKSEFNGKFWLLYAKAKNFGFGL